MSDVHEPDTQGPEYDPTDDPYYKSAPPPLHPDEEHRRRRWVAILLSILVIPLLVAVALAGGDNTGTGSADCSTGDPANAANCPTTAAIDTTPILTPGNPEPPTTTTTDPNGGVVPLPPVTPPPPSYNPNPPSYNPVPPATPPAAPAPPAPTPPAPPAPPAPPPPPANPPEYDGPPKLTRSDGGQALFNLPNVGGGKTVTRCVTIKYNGVPSARVRLYGILSGTGLDNYIDFKVTRGKSSSATNGSCSGFTADTTNYLGEGQGVVFDDLLSDFPLTFESADDEPAQADRERWTNNEKHTYKFEVKLRSDNAAQGKTVGFQLRWEARDY